MLGTRAVRRLVEAGTDVFCVLCDLRIKFEATKKKLAVLCNVYEEGRWDRVEWWHEECYSSAGQPHGEPPPYRQKALR